MTFSRQKEIAWENGMFFSVAIFSMRLKVSALICTFVPLISIVFIVTPFLLAHIFGRAGTLVLAFGSVRIHLRLYLGVVLFGEDHFTRRVFQGAGVNGGERVIGRESILLLDLLADFDLDR